VIRKTAPLVLMVLIALLPAGASAQETTRPGSPLQRIPRIGVELVLGAAGGAGMAYGGFLLGCSLEEGPAGAPPCSRFGGPGALAGLALGAPLGVMLGGALLDGDGGVLPTFLGTAAGMAAMFGGFWLLNHYSLQPTPLAPALLALPVLLGVVGYELTSHDSRTAAQAEGRGRRGSLTLVPTASRDGFGVVLRYAE
jgi:hypothetical protein